MTRIEVCLDCYQLRFSSPDKSVLVWMLTAVLSVVRFASAREREPGSEWFPTSWYQTWTQQGRQTGKICYINAMCTYVCTFPPYVIIYIYHRKMCSNMYITNVRTDIHIPLLYMYSCLCMTRHKTLQEVNNPYTVNLSWTLKFCWSRNNLFYFVEVHVL